MAPIGDLQRNQSVGNVIRPVTSNTTGGNNDVAIAPTQRPAGMS
jgi:hypothetical protein